MVRSLEVQVLRSLFIVEFAAKKKTYKKLSA